MHTRVCRYGKVKRTASAHTSDAQRSTAHHVFAPTHGAEILCDEVEAVSVNDNGGV